MYHSRWKETHYQAGFQYGNRLLKNGVVLLQQMKVSKEREEYAIQCIPIYKKHYPEILQEIKGMADGMHVSFMTIASFLLSMYAYTYDTHCSCIAISSPQCLLLGRNSDFLVDIEKLCDSPYYQLDGTYAFIGHTTAWSEMEDGVNEWGLAVGLTLLYPTHILPGINAGMLVRYLLEKCQTTKEAIQALKRLPIGSAQTITLADKTGEIAVVECNCDCLIVRWPQKGIIFTTNHYISQELQSYQYQCEDDIHSHERYQTLESFVKIKNNEKIENVQALLSGKYGFMCQYDRKKGMDTIWSCVYDLKDFEIMRVEGNSSRKKYQIDKRLHFQK